MPLLAQIAPNLSPSFHETTSEAFDATITQATERLDMLAHPEVMLEMLESMSLVLAAILFAVGSVCLVCGWRWHRVIVLVLALLGGMGLGHLLSLSMGRSMVIAIAVGILCAALAAPMLKWTIAILAGVVGAFVGANAWGLFAPDDPTQAWAGAAMGFIVLAMASFVLSRLVITFFMSVSGGVLLVSGAIALLLHVDSVRDQILGHLEDAPMVLPLLVVVASAIGFIIQRPSLGNRSHDETEMAEA